MLLILTIPFLIAFYFLLIRPQQQRVRDHEMLIAQLGVGDRIVTAGGIHGVLTAVGDDTVEVEVAQGVRLTLARPAIARLQDDSLPSVEPLDPPAIADDSSQPPTAGESIDRDLDDPSGDDPR